MKTWKGLITSVAIASMTLLSYPGVSLGIDCSYNGVFNPPLPIVDTTCAASGSLKARGSLFIDASSIMFVRQPGVTINITEEPQGFPFTTIPGSLTTANGGGIGTVQPILSPIEFRAAGQINNFAGGLNLIAPTDPVRLKAGKGIDLQGSQAVIDPSSLIIADTVRLETTRGNIVLNNNTVLLSWGDNADVSLVAPRGQIRLTNTTIVVLKSGVEIGTCKFQAKTVADVIFGPGTNLFCIPDIKD